MLFLNYLPLKPPVAVSGEGIRRQLLCPQAKCMLEIVMSTIYTVEKMGKVVMLQREREKEPALSVLSMSCYKKNNYQALE